MGAVEDLVVQAAGQVFQEPLFVFPVLEPLQRGGTRIETVAVQGHLRAHESRVSSPPRHWSAMLASRG